MGTGEFGPLVNLRAMDSLLPYRPERDFPESSGVGGPLPNAVAVDERDNIAVAESHERELGQSALNVCSAPRCTEAGYPLDQVT